MFCRDAHDGVNDMIVHDEAPKHFFNQISIEKVYKIYFGFGVFKLDFYFT